MKFPVDAPRRRVPAAMEILGFHLALARKTPDGKITPMTIPNHPTIKRSTLRTICTQAGISREEFLRAYGEV